MNWKKQKNCLLKLGYVKDDYIQTVLNDWKWRHHHVTYFHPEKEDETRNSLEIKSWSGKRTEFR